MVSFVAFSIQCDSCYKQVNEFFLGLIQFECFFLLNYASSALPFYFY